MNTTQMKQSECVRVANALINWFVSQGISSQNAAPIMCMVLAGSIKVTFKDAQGQNKAIEAITQMLHEFNGG